ncbi:DUF3822 family protein [Apibacter raozihei]|uniref:DUF3822 family protein n=1 Tax=Apibacter raozihei TaxID=2500547 RepID=UPI0013E3FF92|nr:DUF3822 family protein [Apibacter raozihei]
MGTKKNINITQFNSVSFLFEYKKFTYIESSLEHETNKKTFPSESINLITNIEKISDKLSDINFFQHKYSFIDLSILSEKFTLIPLEYFEENLAESFLNQTVPFAPNMSLRFNLVPQYDLVLVFYYQEKIENLFSGISDKIRVSHTGFKFLSKIKDQNRRNGYFINFYQEYFELAVVENNGLILYNIYPYSSIIDIIYFLKTVAKITDTKLARSILYYYGSISEKLGKETMFSTYFREVLPGTDDKFERENFTTLDII